MVPSNPFERSFTVPVTVPLFPRFSSFILSLIKDHPSIEDEVSPWLQKMHSLVVGPGLGRSFSLMSPAKIIVNKAIELGIPLVIDADGIYLVSCDPDLIQGCYLCVDIRQ